MTGATRPASTALPSGGVVSPLSDALSAWALRRADAVRALSPFTARLVEETTGRPAAGRFPTYSDLSAFTAGPRLPLPGSPSLLFVGVARADEGRRRRWPRPGAASQEPLPEARLVVVGRGSLEPVVERLVNELPGSVEHVAELSPEQVAARMDAATVLVLPSLSEGLGRVIIESFARGRGVVASSTGGIEDLVADGVEGLLVPPGDAAALAAALTRVLSDPALAERLGSAASARFEALGLPRRSRYADQIAALGDLDSRRASRPCQAAAEERPLPDDRGDRDDDRRRRPRPRPRAARADVPQGQRPPRESDLGPDRPLRRADVGARASSATRSSRSTPCSTTSPGSGACPKAPS